MLGKILPNNLYKILQQNINFNDLYEVRLRLNKPIIINLKNKTKYVTNYGVSVSSKEAIICNKDILNSVINTSTKHSIYAFNDQIKQGFIWVEGGIRLGVIGQAVLEHGKVKTIKNFSSINIRFPHEVVGCSKPTLKYLLTQKSIYNTLIISSPGAGKTTFLRDLSYQLGLVYSNLNLLIIDERNELASAVDGIDQLSVGNNADVISGIGKKEGFELGIRSMNPHVIFTDEIANTEDIEAINYASGCGVKVIASTHSLDLNSLKTKANFKQLINNKVFNRYVILSARKGAGTIENIYDENFNKLMWGIMKVVLIIVVILGFSYIGNGFGGWFFKKKKLINNIVNFCGLLKVQIDFSNNEISKIIENNMDSYDYALKGILKSYVKLLKKESHIDLEVLRKNIKTNYLEEEELNTLLSFFNELGKSDKDNQINIINNYLVTFNSYLKESEISAKKYGTLFKKLGFFAGVLVSIILL